MSKHYEERYYGREEVQDDYDEHKRSSSRRRSSSRSRHRFPQHEEQYYRHGVTRSGSGSSISSMSDYEYRAQCSTERPMVRVPRDVIRAPTPPPVIQRVVERAPTPEPDIVERVIVRPQPQQLIERIIERPRTPPPKIIDKEICEPAPPPIVRTRIVKVDHSPRHYANSNPVRYVQNSGGRGGLYNYGASNDYDYGNYDPSYSSSYSTTELFQPNAGYTTYASAYPSQSQHSQAPQPQQQQLPPQIQISYQPGPSSMGMTSQAAYNNPNSYGGGYTYGYRPTGGAGYNATPQPGPIAQQQNVGYPRPY